MALFYLVLIVCFFAVTRWFGILILIIAGLLGGMEGVEIVLILSPIFVLCKVISVLFEK